MKRTPISATVATMVLLGANAVRAETYDLVTDFPDHQGGNSFYALAYNGTSYRQLDEHPTSAYAFVSRDANLWWVPYVSRDHIGDNLNTGYIAMHPSEWTWVVGHDPDHLPPAENAVLAWRASEDGFATLAGEFYKPAYTGCGVTVCNGVEVYVRRNADLLWSTTLNNRNGSGMTFDLASISVHAGDYIYFGVSGRGNDQWDETFLKGSITTAVPEPETYAMFLAGLGLLGVVARRRRTASAHGLAARRTAPAIWWLAPRIKARR